MANLINKSFALFTIIISITIVDQVINTIYLANIFIASLFFPALGGFLWWKTGEKAVWITTIVVIAAGFTTMLMNNYSGGFDINKWMFLNYVIISPAAVIMGIIISHFEKPTDQFILKRVKFFDKVGAPWFGKKAYREYKNNNA